MSSTSSSSTTFLRDRHHHHSHPHCNHPSFSSSLLEEIYRSFDGDIDHRPTDDCSYRMKKTGSNNNNIKLNNSTTYLQRRDNNRFILDHWMETTNNFNLRRTALSHDKSLRNDHRRTANSSSSTSSSDSGSGIGGFSSSDSESLYGYSSKPKQKPPSEPPLKVIRTALNPAEFLAAKKKKKEGNLQRRALKLYGDLKKVKQPISPGGKLSTFLNSLFNAGALKKPKTSSSSSSMPQSPSISSNCPKFVERESPATPSTAASRSCLSKTPSTAGKFERRSVRFVDHDDDRGHVMESGGDVAKCDSSSWGRDKEFDHDSGREKHRISVEEVAKELLKNYHNRKELTVNRVADKGRKFKNDDDLIIAGLIEDDEDQEEEEDDDISCCSSDLFELENLLDIGVAGRYREELPVFETTNLVDTNMGYR